MLLLVLLAFVLGLFAIAGISLLVEAVQKRRSGGGSDDDPRR